LISWHFCQTAGGHTEVATKCR